MLWLVRSSIGIALFIFTVSFARANDLTTEQSPKSEQDILVLDQEGQERSFFKDVVGDRQAVVNFIYTHCEGICSTLGRRMVSLQKLLGPDSKVALISISLDPEHDRPSDLKSWSMALGARPGWTLLTGKRESLDQISQRIFGTGLISRDMHAPVIVLRNELGQWIRLDGLSPVNDIQKRLSTVARQANSSVKK